MVTRAANPEHVVSGADGAWEMPDDRDQHREGRGKRPRERKTGGEEGEGV